MKVSKELQHIMDTRFVLYVVAAVVYYYAAALSFYQAIIISLLLILSSLPIAAILILKPIRSKKRDILLTLVGIEVGLLNFLLLPENYASGFFEASLLISVMYLLKNTLDYLISKAE